MIGIFLKSYTNLMKYICGINYTTAVLKSKQALQYYQKNNTFVPYNEFLIWYF